MKKKTCKHEWVDCYTYTLWTKRGTRDAIQAWDKSKTICKLCGKEKKK